MLVDTLLLGCKRDENRATFWRTTPNSGRGWRAARIRDAQLLQGWNLHQSQGKEIFKDLVRDADVVVENYAVGTMEEFGLGYKTLSDINPELIYAHGSGFGEYGPKNDRLAMDLIIQANGGVMDVTGFPNGPPVKTGIAPGDFLGGIHLASGVLAALYERERTGEGQFVEASMYDAVYPALMSQLGSYYKEKGATSRTGNRHAGLAKCPYNAYEATDGHVAILCTSDKHWHQLLEVINKEELKSEAKYESNVKRLNHIDKIDEMITDWTSTRSRDEVESAMLDNGIPCSVVQNIEEVMHDPHLEEREMVNEIDHPSMDKPIRVPGSPIRLSNSRLPDIEPSPTKGEDNHAVLQDRLGFTTEEIKQLEDDGVI